MIFGPKIYLILYPSLENSITHITWGACYGCPGAEISAWVFWGVRPNSWTRPRCPPTWRWRLTTFLVGCGGQTHGCAEAHGRGLAVWPGPNISQCVWKKWEFLIPDFRSHLDIFLLLSHNKMYLICVFCNDFLWFKAHISNKVGILDCCNFFGQFKKDFKL